MSVMIRIPTPLQKLAGSQAAIPVEANSVAEALAALEAKYPGFREKLYDASGKLRRFVNFFVNDEDIRFLNGEATAVKAGDEISIVPAIAGGR